MGRRNFFGISGSKFFYYYLNFFRWLKFRGHGSVSVYRKGQAFFKVPYRYGTGTGTGSGKIFFFLGKSLRVQAFVLPSPQPFLKQFHVSSTLFLQTEY